MSNSKGPGFSRWLLPILSIIMALALLYLANENIQLKRQLETALAHPPLPQSLQPGADAVPFAVQFPDGQELNLRTDSLSAPLVFAWFSSDCEPCLAARARWNELADIYPGQFWGLARDRYAAADSAFSGDVVRFPVVTPLDEKVYTQYRIASTPTTMLIKTDGTVESVWHGPLTQTAFDEIVNTMGHPYAERR